VRAIGSSVTGVQGDIAKLSDLDRLYEAVKSKGRIDIVFANAGVAEFAPLGKITEEHFDTRRRCIAVAMMFSPLINVSSLPKISSRQIVVPSWFSVKSARNRVVRMKCGELIGDLRNRAATPGELVFNQGFERRGLCRDVSSFEDRGGTATRASS
jgi:short chain dehydrogenase